MSKALDPSSGVPLFQQIASEIERQILTGGLAEGDFIPSVRDFAVTHAVNPNTVAKAYLLLQERELVSAVRGKGLMVAKVKASRRERRRDELVAAKLDELVEVGRVFGFSARDLARLLQERERKEKDA